MNSSAMSSLLSHSMAPIDNRIFASGHRRQRSNDPILSSTTSLAPIRRVRTDVTAPSLYQSYGQTVPMVTHLGGLLNLDGSSQKTREAKNVGTIEGTKEGSQPSYGYKRVQIESRGSLGDGSFFRGELSSSHPVPRRFGDARYIATGQPSESDVKHRGDIKKELLEYERLQQEERDVRRELGKAEKAKERALMASHDGFLLDRRNRTSTATSTDRRGKIPHGVINQDPWRVIDPKSEAAKNQYLHDMALEADKLRIDKKQRRLAEQDGERKILQNDYFKPSEPGRPRPLNGFEEKNPPKTDQVNKYRTALDQQIAEHEARRIRDHQINSLTYSVPFGRRSSKTIPKHTLPATDLSKEIEKKEQEIYRTDLETQIKERRQQRYDERKKALEESSKAFADLIPSPRHPNLNHSARRPESRYRYT